MVRIDSRLRGSDIINFLLELNCTFETTSGRLSPTGTAFVIPPQAGNQNRIHKRKPWIIETVIIQDGKTASPQLTALLSTKIRLDSFSVLPAETGKLADIFG